MKIVKLKAENIKRIKVVEIDTDGKNFIEITGKNGQGKSSILDSIAYALGGKSLIPERPIRDGETFGNIEVDLGEFVVRRLFTPEGSTIKITNKEGFTKTSPQAYLDSLIGTLSFDPVSFMQMEPKKRIEMFKKLAGIDTTQLDNDYKHLYEERRSAGIELKRTKANLESLEQYKTPVDIVDISQLQAERDFAISRNEKIEKSKSVILELTEKNKLILLEIEKLKAEFETNNFTIETRNNFINEYTSIDLAPLDEKINSIKELWVKKSKHDQYLAAKEFYETVEKYHSKLELDAESILAKKYDLIQKANLPVAGLTIGDDDNLYYNGIPFDQLSQAERLKVSTAMAIAENPELKIIRISDGALLDHEAKQVLMDMANENDYQVFVETVSDENPNNGALYIYDGKIAE